MEKIKQALDRAREGQPSGKRIPGNRTATKKRKDNEVGVQNIVYDQTRVLPIESSAFVQNKIVVGTDSNLAAETAFKILRTQVEHRLAANGWKSLAITSPGAGAGKTFTASNLSVALAQEMHRTVLLVDADFRNSAVHQRFSVDAEQGLIDYLIDDVPLSDILINPGIDRLVLLPAGNRPVTNSSELLSSPRMINLVDELKNRYPSRLIIFDMPPVLSSDDALAFSPYVDATLLVLSAGITSKQEIKRTAEVLERVNLIGTVFNRASENQPVYEAY